MPKTGGYLGSSRVGWRVKKWLKTMPRVNGRLVKQNKVKVVDSNNQANDLVLVDTQFGLNLDPEFQIRQQLPQANSTKVTVGLVTKKGPLSLLPQSSKDVVPSRVLQKLQSFTPITGGAQQQQLKTFTQPNSQSCNNGPKGDLGMSVTREEIYQCFELLRYLDSCGTILIREKSPAQIRIKIELFLSGLVGSASASATTETTTASAGGAGNSETAKIPHLSSSSSKAVTTMTTTDSAHCPEDLNPSQTHSRTLHTKVYPRNEERLPEMTGPSKVPGQNSPPILPTSATNLVNIEDFIKEEPDEEDADDQSESESVPESDDVSIKKEAEEPEDEVEPIIPDSIEDPTAEEPDDEDKDEEPLHCIPAAKPEPKPTIIFPESKYRFCTTWIPTAVPNFENPRLPPPDPIDPLNRPELPHHLRFKGKLKCPEVGCGKILPSVRSFRVHKRLQHSNLPKPPAAAPQSHLCSICGTVYKSKSGLDRHLKTHSGVPLEKTFLCDQCPKAYHSSYQLKAHVTMTHRSDEKPKYVCPVCAKGFRMKLGLKRHSVVHSAEMPFKCEFCERAFREKKTLTQHLGIHTGVKKHKCGPCGLSFVQIGSLKYHNRMHHDAGDGASASAAE